MKKSNEQKMYTMIFGDIYKLYLIKIEKKARTKEELDTVISWLTGYSKKEIKEEIKNKSNFEDFFKKAPKINPNRSKITGMICGHRIEDIKDKLARKVRYLDKLVDELAKGRSIDKILRK